MQAKLAANRPIWVGLTSPTPAVCSLS